MMSLAFVFWMFVVLFGIIGAMRGWVKELLVSFSVLLCLALNLLLRKYVPPITTLGENEIGLFWIRTLILLLLVFFGYQTINIPGLTGKAAREKLQDTLLGGVFGAINGYLVVGTLWHYINQAGYPFTYIQPPNPADPMGQAALELLPYMPPLLLGEPGIYFAVIIAFIFVLVVFL
ncbi:MAG: CvpA family protein [Anaerolineales bacterium]